VVGITLRHDSADRAQFSDGQGSFSFVAGDEPTENVHLAFGVHDFAAVERFHTSAMGAGYRDNGAPGSGRSTTPATTALSSSTPTRTTSRPSFTTAASAARATRVT